jgi:hypothetical protein
MINIPNKLVIFGAVAAAALVVPGVVGALTFQQAYADHQTQAIDRVEQNARGLVNVQANVQAQVQANVEDNEVAVCAVIAECDVDQ